MARKIIITVCMGLMLASFGGRSAVLAQTQAEMNRAAGVDFKQADAEMSTVYWHLMKKLDKRGKTALLASQRAWLHYREAEATLRTIKSEGGTMHSSAISGCLIKITKARTQELQTDEQNLNAEGML